MRRLGVKARLTIVVTACFAVVLTTAAIVLVGAVERSVREDTRRSITAVLASYLDDLAAGRLVPDEAFVDGVDVFYLDGDGRLIDQDEYVSMLVTHVSETSGAAVLIDDGIVVVESAPVDAGDVRADTGVTVQIGESPFPRPGPIEELDRGPEVLAVGAPVTIGDSTVTVGAAGPVETIDRSVAALRRVLWWIVPMMTLIVGAMVWAISRRALRPVHSMAARVRTIGATDLSTRVAVPAPHDEVRELADTMNAMLDRVEEASRRQRRFVADASHELRSPLAAIRAQLEVGAQRPDDTDWPSTVTRVLQEQDRLERLVADLLTMARTGERPDLLTEDVDLDAVALEVGAGRGGAIETIVRQPARVRGDRRLLERIMTNLLDNALAHASSARLTVDVDAGTDDAVIIVDDDGPGIPTHERDSVFERFRRVEESRSRDRGGAGLGLAIVREAAELHGGNVRCRDSELGGACLEVRLPLAYRNGSPQVDGAP